MGAEFSNSEENLQLSLRGSPWGSYYLMDIRLWDSLDSIQLKGLCGGTISNETLIITGPPSRNGLKVGQEVTVSGQWWSNNSRVICVDDFGKVCKDEKLPANEKSTKIQNTPRLLATQKDFFNGLLQLELNSNHALGSLLDSSFIESEDSVYIDNQHLLDGVKIVKSKTAIVVENGLRLSNQWFIAPSIVIRKNVQGPVQVLCKHNCTVDTSSYLQYPSSIMLLGDAEEIKEGILIGDSVVFEGSISAFLLEDSNTTSRRSPKRLVLINQSATIEGEIISNSMTELRGRLLGQWQTESVVSTSNGPLEYGSMRFYSQSSNRDSRRQENGAIEVGQGHKLYTI